ncbi:MAG: pilus assembly protein TadG-related protein [Pseudomonadota bacterium]
MRLQAFSDLIFSDRRGHVAIVLAICVVPLFLVIGSALDLRRQSNMQNQVQNALDFAVIATARHALKTNADNSELQAVSQRFFDGKMKPMAEATLNAVKFSRNDDLITLEVDGEIPTSVMQIVGNTTLPIGTQSAARYGEPSAAEIALVLDTSYSMTGTRMNTLKTAARDMIDTLVSPSNESVKMSVVPFATYVNVGTDKKGSAWLSVEADQTSTWTNCSPKHSWYKKNCEKETYACSEDGVNKTCTRWDCDADELAAAPKECKTQSSTQTWHGCVKSRPDPLNIKDISYVTKPIEGFVTGWSGACPTEIQELTNIPGQLKSTVAKLSANQETYIATGLVWGYRTLTDVAPFSEGLSYTDLKSKNGRKALVLMSDGANTKAPASNGKHTSSDVWAANDITEDVCDEVKSQGIEIYTIAFEVSDSTTKTLLEDCATDSTYYYDAKNSSDLKQAFENIGDTFREIALAK